MSVSVNSWHYCHLSNAAVLESRQMWLDAVQKSIYKVYNLSNWCACCFVELFLSKMSGAVKWLTRYGVHLQGSANWKRFKCVWLMRVCVRHTSQHLCALLLFNELCVCGVHSQSWQTGYTLHPVFQWCSLESWTCSVFCSDHCIDSELDKRETRCMSRCTQVPFSKRLTGFVAASLSQKCASWQKRCFLDSTTQKYLPVYPKSLTIWKWLDPASVLT